MYIYITLTIHMQVISLKQKHCGQLLCKKCPASTQCTAIPYVITHWVTLKFKRYFKTKLVSKIQLI